jgi:FkbM family methyltransferase
MAQKIIKTIAYYLNILIVRLRKNKITGIDLRHDIKQLIEVKNPIILDIGANKGQSIKLFRELWPSSFIHSFEPTKSLAEILINQFQNSTTIINETAMGAAPTKATLNINQKSGLNSILNLDSSPENRFREKKIIATEEVIIDTVDLYLEKHKILRIELLKTDTQGFDFEVLKGAINSIKTGKISNVLIEINFVSLYQNQGKSTEIFEFLFSNKFALVGLYEISRNKTDSSSIDWCTALFTFKMN